MRLSGKGPNLEVLMTLLSEPFSMSSKIMYKWVEVRKDPRYLTILRWLRFWRSSTSLATPERASADRCSKERALMATCSPVLVSKPRKTVP